MNKPLTDKVALVTGGSRGLGAATVRLPAEQGADVAFTYVSSDQRAKAVVDEVRGKGAKAVAFRTDQADMGRAPALIDDVVAHFGGLRSSSWRARPRRTSRARCWTPTAATTPDLTHC